METGFMKKKRKIETPEIVILVSLFGLGVGLYFWYGLGPALTIPFALLFIIGFIGAYEHFFIILRHGQLRSRRDVVGQHVEPG